MTAAEFVSAVCKQDRDEHDNVDLIMNWLDDAQIEGRFGDCDEAFRLLDGPAVARLRGADMVSVLAITRVAAGQGKFTHRSALFGRVVDEMAERKGRQYAIDLLTKYQ